MNEQEVKNLKGLSDAQAADFIKKQGFNELPSSKKKNIFSLLFEIIKEPMFLLLIACGILYLILGDVQEAIMLLGFVFVIIGITLYQEGKTEKALDALKDLSSPRALVIRNGEQIRIAGREVAEGDLVILVEGDRVPADAVLLWGNHVAADESLLTGESAAVRKKPASFDCSMERPGGDDLPFVYSGSLIVSGQGVALVKATGIRTEMGRIGKALQELKPETTLLQKETSKIVKFVFIAAIMMCALIVIFYGVTTGKWVKGILSGLTLAMAMLPEEFPVVLTIFLALGAWRISKKMVLTRKSTAVETLGAATVLCTDKTGTLTWNRMTIKKLFNGKDLFTIDESKQNQIAESFHELVEYGILASQKDPFDPMEKAFKSLGSGKLADTEHLHPDWEIVKQYPLSPELLAMTHVWKADNGGYVIAAKGAPESIIDLCHLSPEKADMIKVEIQKLAGEGLRVLGVAKSNFNITDLPPGQHDFDFDFLGLVALEDPIRETVPEAIKECYHAGIRVIMITGDYPVTASNIAKQIGLKNSTDVLTGSDIMSMSEEDLRLRLKTVNVFARVVPEQKLKIVNALKASGEIVAMTGDGVNDAPALKSAHIGIAMGERGTDVAREASALVLLDDSFPAIVSAVNQGRQIYDNIRKAMAYIISVHIPIAGASLIPILMNWPVELLSAVHIVFLELIIDPACTIVFEGEKADKDIMDRPPRDSKQPLFSKKTLFYSLMQGFVALALVMGVFQFDLWMNSKSGMSTEMVQNEAKTMAFAALIFSNLFLILTNRSWNRTIISKLKDRNNALFFVFGGALFFLGVVIYVPFAQKLFHFSALPISHLGIAFAAAFISVLWFEIVKVVAHKLKKSI